MLIKEKDKSLKNGPVKKKKSNKEKKIIGIE